MKRTIGSKVVAAGLVCGMFAVTGCSKSTQSANHGARELASASAGGKKRHLTPASDPRSIPHGARGASLEKAAKAARPSLIPSSKEGKVVVRKDVGTLDIVDAASYNSIISGDQVVSAFGKNLGLANYAEITIIDGKGVELNSYEVTLYGVFDGQLNMILPAVSAPADGYAMISAYDKEFDASIGTDTLTLIADGAVNLDDVAPALFTADFTGDGKPAGQMTYAFRDGSQEIHNLNESLVVPADATDVVMTLWSTGARAAACDNNSTVRVWIESSDPANPWIEAGVAYFGEPYAGVQQINVTLTDLLAGTKLYADKSHLYMDVQDCAGVVQDSHSYSDVAKTNGTGEDLFIEMSY